MTPHVVADVGNTRIKWGRCSLDAVTDMASLPPDDHAAWQERFDVWRIAAGCVWVIAGVHPARRDRLADWLLQRRQQVRVVTQPQELPLRTLLAEPEKAGIDRLLDAVAANHHRKPGHATVIVDAGSAVTVDYLDEKGAFAGGAILPGFRLMAKSLHEYTALLPIVELPPDPPRVPGTATIPAMEAGVFWAVAGGVDRLICEYRALVSAAPLIFLTGGDAEALAPVLEDAFLWPAMTLEGLRWTAEALTT
jgi:type III pantothenate kinase